MKIEDQGLFFAEDEDLIRRSQYTIFRGFIPKTDLKISKLTKKQYSTPVKNDYCIFGLHTLIMTGIEIIEWDLLLNFTYSCS